MARKNAVSFGFAVSGLYAVVGRQALTAIIVLGAIWLLNDYRGVPSCSAADVAVTRRNVYGNADGIWTTHLYRRQSSGNVSGINVERTKLAVFKL